MIKKISVIAAVIAVAGVLLYLSRSTSHSPVADRATTRPVPDAPLAKTPVVQTICVVTIQNLSHRPMNMDGIDDELVVQLQKTGFTSSRKVTEDNGKQCDAIVNGELVELSGRARKTARVDFRLTLTGEQPPRMSASALGKSAEKEVTKLASNFSPAEASTPQANQERAEHDAVSAAIEQQALQIQAAYKRGLPPWLPTTP
jgi:hypothetical protein